MTSATFLSDGFTINSLPCTMAKSYGRNAGTWRAALLGTALIFNALGTTAPAAASRGFEPFLGWI
jgi:hypothetical protein